MAGGFERQQRTANGQTAAGEHGHPRALGEARRPGADRDDFETMVRLDGFDHGAEHIEVRHNRAIRAPPLTWQIGAYRTATRELVGDVELVELGADRADNLIGHSCRARQGEQLKERGGKVIDVDHESGAGFDQIMDGHGIVLLCSRCRDCASPETASR